MPAYYDNGFSVRLPMWHNGFADTIEQYPEDWADARRLAGIEWEPEAVQSWHDVTGQPGPLDPAAIVTSDGRFLVPASGYRMTRRSDTKAPLGQVTDSWSPIYHDERGMGQIFDALMGETNVKFETAGSCNGGKQVWGLAVLDEPYTVPGDDTEHLPFLAVLNDHSGNGACRATKTQVRVVCWNTFNAAWSSSAQAFTFRHAGDVAARIEEAKAAVNGLRQDVVDYLDLAEDLTKIKVDDERVKIFLSEFLPSPRENGEIVSDRVHANVERARGVFHRLYSDSITTESVRGTGFGLLQASTEYLDHVRSFRSSDTMLGRSILGSEPAKAKAVALIRGLR